MPESTRSSLTDLANSIVESATEHLRARFADSFEPCISVGLMGSCARGDLSPCSDIDYCVTFETRDAALRDVELAEVIEELHAHVLAAFPEEPLARRFSVFWAPLEDLERGRSGVGRWPPFDRGAFRQEGKHVAGRVLDRSSFAPVSWNELRVASVGFVVNEMRPRLEAIRFFETLQELSAEHVRRLGSVLVTKCVLMPIRMLHVASPAGRVRPFVGPEEAIRSCAASCSKLAWWTLVEGAAKWRRLQTMGDEELEEAAHSFGAHAPGLYRYFLDQYGKLAAEAELFEDAENLRRWTEEIRSTDRAGTTA